MKENYPKAYTEVLEILKYMPKDDVDKIPKKLIDTFEYKKDNEYNFIIEENQDFSNLEMLDETQAIILNLFKDYWATDEQKMKINSKIQEDIRIIDEKKKEKCNADIFKTNEKNIIENQEVKDELAITTNDEGIFQKIKNFFRKLLNKNK